MGGNVNRTCFVSQEFHPHGDLIVPPCRIDADVPRHNGGTQHMTDDGVSVRVGLEYLWIAKTTKKKTKQILTSHDTHQTEKTETTDFSALYLHSSVLFVWVEGGVVQAVGDCVFIHPVATSGAQVKCSPLCVDCRHRGLIPKVHLQPLVFIVCSGQPRAHSHVGAAEVKPGVRGPKIFPSCWWGGDLAVRDSSVLHTEWFGAFWGKAQKWKGLS